MGKLRRHARALSRAACLAPAALLAACGGGGGGVASSGSVPATFTPTPTPTPAPSALVPGTYDTAETRRSNAALAANVQSTWNAGYTGAGVTVAVIDSGVDTASAEFAGRLSPASRDVTGAGRPVTDEGGHGTAVSSVLLAARNDLGISGVAPGATLLSLRADRSGTCGADDKCAYSDSAIAAGLDAAVAGGARVVNISLGGSSGTASLRAAYARAAAAGVLVVSSAGNDSAAEVDPLPAAAVAAAGRSAVVVGSIDSAGALADFSNKAGSAAQQYLVALGVRVRSYDHMGTAYLYSGTSISAPVVAGAAALLAQAYPNLTGAQIADLLLRTADDLGAAGADPVFGRGRLNIAAAFAPAGGTSIGAVPVSLVATGSLGGAMGDGSSTGAALKAVPVTDGYGRDYSIDLGGTLARPGAGRLLGALAGPEARAAESRAVRDGGGVSLLLTGGARRVSPALGLAQGGLDAHAANRPLGAVARFTAGATTISAAQGFGLAGLLPGAARRPSLVADDALGGGSGAAGASMVAARAVSGWTLALGAGTRSLSGARAAGVARATRTATVAMTAARSFGPVAMVVVAAREDERGGLFGTRLGESWGLAGASGFSLGAAADLAVGGAQFRAAVRRATMAPRLEGAMLAAGGAVRAGAWSLEAGFGPAWARVAQPLRVDGGALLLAVDGRRIPLAPVGAERAAELGWSLGVPGGRLDLTAYRRWRPGHVAGAPADTGAAIRIDLAR